MSALFGVARMLGRGGSPVERTRARLLATGSASATWFLLAAANVLTLRGHLNEWLGPASQSGTRGGTALALALLLLPVAAFLHQVSRLASADRERRLSALRLAGATPAQVRLLGALETTRSALVGTVAGAVSYLLVQWAARALLLDPGSPADVGIPPALCAVSMVIVLASAAVSGMLAGRHVVATPLSVTVRAARVSRRRLTRPLVIAAALLLVVALFSPMVLPRVRPIAGLVALGILTAGAPASPRMLVGFCARVAGRRARTAETLLAARTLEADPRPWGRTLSVVALAVTVGSAAGCLQAGMLAEHRMSEPFWLSSFILLDLVLLVGIAVAGSALFVHHAEYLLEHGSMLATLKATGTPETALRRVLMRQALIAATPACALAALIGFVPMALPLRFGLWWLWAIPHALFMVGLGVLASVLAAFSSRRRLSRSVAPVRLRTE
ncbi:FtsX-like permease family protein [Actinoallomurus acaciae]|uniref:FtsX-like permease family protein n=1 Tax=Actinoallomurus acaciae TaxID=502577 RepID=A0ABV5YK52_9ACTN